MARLFSRGPDDHLGTAHGAHVDLGWALALVLVGGALVFAVTRVDADADRATASAVSASGAAELKKGLGGDAVVRAGDMQPGRPVSGAVTVGNSGEATGAFRVAVIDVLDTPGPGGGRLSSQLQLRIDDATAGRTVYRGALGRMSAVGLGYLRAGERRTYRFVLDAPARGDYAGSRVETTFDWTAATGDPPARPVRPGDAAPPAVVVQSPAGQRLAGRRITVALSCSEDCTVAGASSGTPLGPRRHSAGLPALQAIELGSAQAAALDGVLESRGRAALPLRVTVVDAAGNRTTVPVTVTLVR